MLNFGQVVGAVQRNCHISDARHGGEHTLCVFLLKMRELYRWEHDLPLSHPLPRDEVGAWLAQREQMWEDLESREFEPLPLGRDVADPFDSEAVNRELVPRGYVYSGGYGRFGKAHFFLGELKQAEQRDGCTVLVSACEYARDLDAPPAMLQGRTVFVRLESARRFLWEKIEESRWAPNHDAMDRALAAHGLAPEHCANAAKGPPSAGLSDRIEAALDRLTEHESQAMILHELGEARAGELLGPAWEEMLAGLSRSRTEIIVRAVRDILADGVSTLPALTGTGNWPSLHFYFANFGGMRRRLYPELAQAYRAAVESGSLTPLKTRLEADTARWLDRAQRLLALHQSGGADLDGAIENLLSPGKTDEAQCRRG